MEEKTRLTIYYLCIALGVLLSGVMFMFICRKKGVKLKDAVMFLITGAVAAFLGVILMAKLDNAVSQFVLGDAFIYPSRFRLLGCLILPPVVLWLPLKYSGYSYDDIMDYFTPGLCITLSVSKIGCAVYGCCYGVECAHGVINPLTGQTVFPVQLSEFLWGLCIALLSLFVLFFSKKYIKGTVYPASLMLFCVGRFILEFFRYYEFDKQEDMLLFMNFWQIVCLALFIMGAVWLFVIFRKHKRKINAD